MIYREPKYLAYTFRSGRGASILLKNGASVVPIRQYLRHASAATTLAHYLVDTEPLASALRKAIG